MKTLLSLALFFIPVISFASMPDFPMSFWGTVTVDGAVVPSGSIIRVYDESTVVGEVVVQESGVYGYTEPTKQKLIVGTGAGELTFKVQSASINGGAETGGISPVTYNGFISGETVQKNLLFVVTEVSSSDEGSSSSGGGGSSKKKVVKPAELVLGVASSTPTTTPSEEEKKIELQKQLIQILTQLIALLKQKMLLGY